MGKSQCLRGERMTFEEILKNEKIEGWTIKRGSSGGLCMYDSKIVLVNDGRNK